MAFLRSIKADSSKILQGTNVKPNTRRRLAQTEETLNSLNIDETFAMEDETLEFEGTYQSQI